MGERWLVPYCKRFKSVCRLGSDAVGKLAYSIGTGSQAEPCACTFQGVLSHPAPMAIALRTKEFLYFQCEAGRRIPKLQSHRQSQILKFNADSYIDFIV